MMRNENRLLAGQSICCLVNFFLALALMILSRPSFASDTLNRIVKTGVINIGYRLSAPPFSYPDANRNPIGYSIDLCSRIVEAIKIATQQPNLEINYVSVSPATRITALASNIIDLECGSTTNTAERRRSAAFTVPIYIAGIRILARKDSQIKNINDLARKKIVTVHGTSAEKVLTTLNENRALKAQIILAPDYQEAFLLLDAGKAEAFVTDDILLATLQASSAQPEKFILTGEQLTIEPLAIMMRNRDEVFKKLINNEIKRIMQSGEINALYNKWFESVIPHLGINLNLPMDERLQEVFRSPEEWQSN